MFNGNLIDIVPVCLEKLRITVTISTILALIFTSFYRYYEIRIYKFDNSLSPSVRYVTFKVFLKIMIEITIIAIHPIALGEHMQIRFTQGSALYYFMLLRVVYSVVWR